MNKQADYPLIALLLLPLFSGNLWAHTQLGALGKPASATDIYQVTCLDDGNGPPHHLSTQVMDRAPVAPPMVSVTMTKDGKSAKSTDPIDGDNQYSPETPLPGGGGAYLVSVTKSAKGSEIYTLQYHCITANNVHTGSSLVKKQDQ